MKKLLLFTLVSCAFQAHSQEEQERRFRYLVLDYGVVTYSNQMVWSEIYKQEFKSEILFGYSLDSLQDNYSSAGIAPNRSSNVQLQVGFDLPRKSVANLFTNPRLLVGLNVFSMYSILNFGERQTTNIDTLTSSQTGNQIFIQNERSQVLSYQNQQGIIQLNLSYQTNVLKQEKRINPYVGVGLGGGIVFQNVSKISYRDSETSTGTYNNFRDTVYSENSEKVKSKGNYVLSAEIKTGIDFHLQKLPAWKLFLEYRPGLLVMSSNSKMRSYFKNNFQVGIALDFWKMRS